MQTCTTCNAELKLSSNMTIVCCNADCPSSHLWSGTKVKKERAKMIRQMQAANGVGRRSPEPRPMVPTLAPDDKLKAKRERDAAKKREKRAAGKTAPTPKDPLRDLTDTEADYKTLKKFVERKPKKEAPDMPLPKGVVEPELTHETKQTREEWLLRFTREHCSDLFAKAGKDIPEKIRMSCGWPSSRAMAGKKGRVLGQCWYPEASSDGHHEIFVTPALADPVEVASVLIHELVHSVCGKEAGHGPRFKELASGVGLEGKMTATVPSAWLKEWIAKASQEVGAYPHATLDMSQVKKQTTRLLKIVCVNPECDFLAENEKPYSVRMSATVFEAGKPCCGVCQDRMEEADEPKASAPKSRKGQPCPDCGEPMGATGCPQCSFFAAREEERAHGDD